MSSVGVLGMTWPFFTAANLFEAFEQLFFVVEELFISALGLLSAGVVVLFLLLEPFA